MIISGNIKKGAFNSSFFICKERKEQIWFLITNFMNKNVSRKQPDAGKKRKLKEDADRRSEEGKQKRNNNGRNVSENSRKQNLHRIIL